MSKKASAERLQNKKLQKQEQKKKKTRKILIITTSIILIVALLTATAVVAVNLIDNIIKDSGDRYRETVVFESEHYTVNAAMMSYFFYDMLYGGILEEYDAKKPEDLKEIDYGSDGNSNLYDYFSEYAATRMRNYLLYAEAAIDNEISLNEAELSEIENRLASFATAAAALGSSEEDYIFGNYGRGINKTDIRAVLELTALADKQLSVLYNEQTATAEEVADYIAEADAMKYYRVDYYMVDLSIDVDQEDGAYQKEHDRIKALTEELAECHSLEAFLEKAKEIYTKEYTDKDGNLTIEGSVDDLIQGCFFEAEQVERVTDDSNVIDEWVYDFAREAGDTLSVDGKRSLAALFMVKPAYSVDTPVTAVRYIAIDARNYLQTSNALAKLNSLKKDAEQNLTEEHFIELAKQYSEDAMNASKGGLCEDTYAEDSFCKAIATWLTDSKKGDLTTVTVGNCYYLVYNIGEGRTRSEIDAELSVISQKYTKALESYTKDIEISLPDTTHIGVYAPLA